MPASQSLIAGLARTSVFAGTLDALGASTHFFLRTGKSPAGVWRYVASALLGPTALAGGSSMVFTGIAMHYAIAFGWTALFFFAASCVSALRGSPWIIGPCYGLFVWLTMTRVVVPMTLIGPPGRFNPVQAAIGLGIIMLCVGTPIAVGASRTFPRTAAP